jgi:hypothetical protein
MDISTATIDRGGYKRKATDGFKRVHDESPRYNRAMPGNQLVVKYIFPIYATGSEKNFFSILTSKNIT